MQWFAVTSDPDASPNSTGPEASTRGATAGRGREAGRGVKDMLPVLVGYSPFAIVVGGAVAANHDTWAAWAGTWMIYSGAGQLAVLSGLAAGSGAMIVIVAGLVVNARLVIYSASIADSWRTERRWRKALAAAILTDPLWVAATHRHGEPGTDAQRRQYYLGAGSALWIGWLSMVSAAALAGSRVAIGAHLAIATPLCLLALIGPTLRTAGGRAAIGVAALTGLVPESWIGGMGLLVAVSLGTIAGMIGDRGTTRLTWRRRTG